MLHVGAKWYGRHGLHRRIVIYRRYLGLDLAYWLRSTTDGGVAAKGCVARSSGGTRLLTMTSRTCEASGGLAGAGLTSVRRIKRTICRSFARLRK